MLNYSLDFDDLIIKSVDVLSEYEDVREKWQNRINHILVDEFQDVDWLQYELLKLLAGDKNDVTVVGDPDQTIYTWRGADVNIILNFEKDFAPCKTIQLEQNYRSTGKILAIANELISHNQNRLPKNLFTKIDGGAEIGTYFGDNEKDEARFVVKNIMDLYDGKNVFYKDFAVLYRNNSQSAAIETYLMENKIKYRIYGGIRFYRRAEIKDCIAYLKLAYNFNDNLSCARLLENCGKSIGDTTINKLETFADEEQIPQYEYMQKHFDDLPNIFHPKQGKSMQDFVERINKLHDNFILVEKEKITDVFNKHLHDCGYIDMYIASDDSERIDNIKEFLNQMSEYLKKEETTLEDFILDAALMSAQDEIDDDDDDYVKLMTVHTAKGLEFKNVFVYGLVEQIFPNQRTMMESPDGLEEERRLFYVAITRAKERLFLSTSAGESYFGTRHPSRFLREIQIRKEKIEQPKIIKPNNFLKGTIHVGSFVRHDAFGEGIVTSIVGDVLVILFKDSEIGTKKILSTHKSLHIIN